MTIRNQKIPQVIQLWTDNRRTKGPNAVLGQKPLSGFPRIILPCERRLVFEQKACPSILPGCVLLQGGKTPVIFCTDCRKLLVGNSSSSWTWKQTWDLVSSLQGTSDINHQPLSQALFWVTQVQWKCSKWSYIYDFKHNPSHFLVSKVTLPENFKILLERSWWIFFLVLWLAFLNDLQSNAMDLLLCLAEHRGEI